MASASLTNARGVSTSPTGTALATLDQTTAAATGIGTVNILQYDADPAGPPTYASTGVFFDVASSTGNSFSSEVIQDCDLNGGNQFLWWNPSAYGGSGAWEPVIGDPGPIYTAGRPACLSATLDANSTPTISQLTGTVFAVGTTSVSPALTSSNYVEVQAGGEGPLPGSNDRLPLSDPAGEWVSTAGVTFHDNGNGTGLISGTAPSTVATYPITLTATNTNGTATQTFFIGGRGGPALPRRRPRYFKVGSVGKFTVGSTGSPTSVMSESGKLPSGVTFIDNGNGTATLAGSPKPGTTGTYSVTFTANNGVSPSAVQHFILTVDQVPAFTSPSSATFTHGVKGTFHVVANGRPTPGKITETGKLPTGVTFTSTGGGVGTLTGKTSTKGTFTVMFKVTNSVGTSSQAFKLVVSSSTRLASDQCDHRQTDGGRQVAIRRAGAASEAQGGGDDP